MNSSIDKNAFEIEPYKILKSLVEVTAAHIGEDFLKIICNELKTAFDADLVFITKPIDSNPITRVKILYATESSLPESFDLEGSPCQLVYDEGIIQISQGVNQNFIGAKGTPFESFYGIPINNKEKSCIGHIAMFSSKKRVISKEVEDIIKIFSRRIETEYERDLLEKENKKNRKKLERLTITDPLTKLFNRRYFNKFSTDTLKQVKRFKHEVSIAFIDIDDFKVINDQYGHKVGDDVLKYFANILLKSSRKSIDYIFRIGGEEFTIISINSSKEKSLNLFNRINNKLEKKPFNDNIKLTISIGMDKFKEDDKCFDEIYLRVDEKLYEAKNSGKNTIIS